MPKDRKLPSVDRLREAMLYDPQTGSIVRGSDSKRGRWKAGSPMGTLSKGYLYINLDRVIYGAHRMIWKYMTGEDPSGDIDHINGNPSDNRWCNLRVATRGQNTLNRTALKNNKLGAKGVHQIKTSGRFRARVGIGYKSIDLGVFGTLEEAKAAYDAAAKVLHGDFFKS